MSVKEFHTMRLVYFFEAVQGYLKERDEKVRLLSVLIRRATVEIFNTQVADGYKQTPEGLWPLPWDEEIAEINGPTAEQVREHQLQMIKALKERSDG